MFIALLSARLSLTAYLFVSWSVSLVIAAFRYGCIVFVAHCFAVLLLLEYTITKLRKNKHLPKIKKK